VGGYLADFRWRAKIGDDIVQRVSVREPDQWRQIVIIWFIYANPYLL
jgi:hypothetical protein